MPTARSGISSVPSGADFDSGYELSLDRYSRTIFRSLRRIDQRNWAHAYLKGLLVTPGKKSVRRLAAAVSRDPSAVQSLRQFVSLSPWDFDEVMAELTRRVTDRRPAPVWSIGRAVLPKRGDRSVGVHRYFDRSSGRTLNCQLGLGSFLCTGTLQIPVDWRLHLPPSWTQDPGRRRDARVPADEEYRPLWAHALRLTDRLSARTGSLSSVVLVDLSDEPDAGLLLQELANRRRDFVVGIPPQLTVVQAGEGATVPMSARNLVLTQSRETVVVPGPGGSPPVTQLQTALVRLPAGHRTPLARLPGDSPVRVPGPVCRLFTTVGRDRATSPVWITSLTHHTAAELASIAALQNGTRTVLESLEKDFGLLDFEGRSYPGWYHHMALVSAACAFRQLHGAPPSAPPGAGAP
ncbi:IS701 family transposase [Streptomyces sp. NPDC003691]